MGTLHHCVEETGIHDSANNYTSTFSGSSEKNHASHRCHTAVAHKLASTMCDKNYKE